MTQVRRSVQNFITLNKGEEDKEKVMADVKENISFRNANLWILACAILIASVGLNVNSTAVIIGAMLISPLMGPIVGAGFALATFDFDLFKRALKNMLVATVVSLVVATVYFFISPFKETQSELLSRTSPTIYDVLIAFFGGIVGVISLTRRYKGNPIPGVAIATALMPPLCTAGYGLAIGNFQYFFGAFYLYTINCFFICIATFLITKYLKYPAVSSVDKKYDKRIHRFISIGILIMIVPSSYLAYDLYQEKKYTQKVQQFLDQEFINKGNIIIYKKTSYQSQPKTIEIAFLSRQFSSEEINEYNDRLKTYNMTNTKIIFKQDIRDLKGEILQEINGQKTVISAKDLEIDQLRKELTSYKIADASLMKEVNILFPDVHNLSFGKHQVFLPTDSTFQETVVVYDRTEEFSEKDQLKLKLWLEQKLELTKLKIIAQ